MEGVIVDGVMCEEVREGEQDVIEMVEERGREDGLDGMGRGYNMHTYIQICMHDIRTSIHPSMHASGVE